MGPELCGCGCRARTRSQGGEGRNKRLVRQPHVEKQLLKGWKWPGNEAIGCHKVHGFRTGNGQNASILQVRPQLLQLGRHQDAQKRADGWHDSLETRTALSTSKDA